MKLVGVAAQAKLAMAARAARMVGRMVCMMNKLKGSTLVLLPHLEASESSSKRREKPHWEKGLLSNVALAEKHSLGPGDLKQSPAPDVVVVTFGRHAGTNPLSGLRPTSFYPARQWAICR